jgi:hypothetical protein
MKKAVTFRFDAALLEDARRCAVRENRTLTNFIETLVKTHVAASQGSGNVPEPDKLVANIVPAPRAS